jgi:hypothetical protein
VGRRGEGEKRGKWGRGKEEGGRRKREEEWEERSRTILYMFANMLFITGPVTPTRPNFPGKQKKIKKSIKLKEVINHVNFSNTTLESSVCKSSRGLQPKIPQYPPGYC